MRKYRRTRRRPAAAVNPQPSDLLDLAAKQVEAIEHEILLGRSSGEAIRDELKAMIGEVQAHLEGQPLKVHCDHRQSPSVWIASILVKAKTRSRGTAEEHLVGAALHRRHPAFTIRGIPSQAEFQQVRPTSDFPTSKVIYHVTGTSAKEPVQRCKENLQTGKHPVLLVPKEFLEKATFYAEEAAIQDRVTILSIEDFITQNVIEISTEQNQDFFTVLQEIVGEYNRRLEEVETDMSLKIELL